MSLVRFVCDAEYANACKRKVKIAVIGDGIVDSVRNLTADFTKKKDFTEYDFISRYVTMMSFPYFIVFYLCTTVSLHVWRLANK